MINLEVINKIYKKVKKMKNGGENAQYIPHLAKVNQNIFAISICMLDGTTYNFGDSEKEVGLESCSKVFNLALALKKFGVNTLQEKIGTYSSSYDFNSIVAANNIENHTINSFNNGGAMATVSLMYQKNQKKFEKELHDNINDFAGRKLKVDEQLFQSEMSTNDHNLSLAYLLKGYNRFYGDVMSCVEAYTKMCSLMVTSKDASIMAATLANNGQNPLTKKTIIDKKEEVQYILTHMLTNGMYTESEKWMTDIGLPAKSGVGGMIIIVVPGVMGIGIVSPPLNKAGNSYKGTVAAKMIAEKLNLNLYNSVL
jgi:glutaminase